MPIYCCLAGNPGRLKRRDDMWQQRDAVRIEELPPRARKLHPDELSKVFGGCGADGQRCGFSQDCCSGKCGFPTPTMMNSTAVCGGTWMYTRGVGWRQI
jgi:hypothetical protein